MTANLILALIRDTEKDCQLSVTELIFISKSGGRISSLLLPKGLDLKPSPKAYKIRKISQCSGGPCTSLDDNRTKGF